MIDPDQYEICVNLPEQYLDMKSEGKICRGRDQNQSISWFFEHKEFKEGYLALRRRNEDHYEGKLYCLCSNTCRSRRSFSLLKGQIRRQTKSIYRIHIATSKTGIPVKMSFPATSATAIKNYIESSKKSSWPLCWTTV